jgi:hypothetical protein
MSLPDVTISLQELLAIKREVRREERERVAKELERWIPGSVYGNRIDRHLLAKQCARHVREMGDGPLAEWPEFAPAVEPKVRGDVDGLASRLDRLRACGNGVVALQAALAFTILARRIVPF